MRPRKLKVHKEKWTDDRGRLALCGAEGGTWHAQWEKINCKKCLRFKVFEAAEAVWAAVKEQEEQTTEMGGNE